MAGRLKDKVAIVVGAGSSGPGWGNGKCTAVTFAREGARVMCVDRKRAAAEETVGLIAKEGGEAVAFEADSSKSADVKAMVDACLAKWGRIDVLDNNVGIGSTGGPVELSEDEWHLVFPSPPITPHSPKAFPMWRYRDDCTELKMVQPVLRGGKTGPRVMGGQARTGHPT